MCPYLLNHLTLGRTKPKEETEKISLLPFWKIFIEERSEEGKGYSPNTLKKYKVVYNGLAKYLKQSRKKYLNYDDIDYNFYTNFVSFLFSWEEINSKNTVSVYITTLKLVMKEAQMRGYHNNNKYRDFRGLSEKSEAIYLSNEEIHQLWKLDLSTNKRLERVRDLFLMGCETGLRFSDFSTIGEENIKEVDGVELLNITQQKTGDVVIIPLKPIAKAILKKYDNKLPRAISNQKMNLYLKELGQMASIDEMVSLYKGGKQIVEKKYNMISTHTARRSFATNAYLARVPSIAIMKITGHRSEKNFLRYIKVDSLQSALNVASHPFFTGSTSDAKEKDKSPLRKVS